MDYRRQIKQEVAKRGIQYLLHFTQAANLPSIVEHGLLSRAELLFRGLDAFASARHRLDDQDEAVSLSISVMNYKMFKAKQKTAGRAAWVVLLLDPSILWTHHCRFCSRSAASKEIKEHRGRMDGPWGFRQMFADCAPENHTQAASHRMASGIPDFQPTHLDAEVQVFGRIASEMIIAAWTDRFDVAEFAQGELNRLPGEERDVLFQQF